MRFLLARYPELMGKVLSIVYRTLPPLNSYMIRKTINRTRGLHGC